MSAKKAKTAAPGVVGRNCATCLIRASCPVGRRYTDEQILLIRLRCDQYYNPKGADE